MRKRDEEKLKGICCFFGTYIALVASTVMALSIIGLEIWTMIVSVLLVAEMVAFVALFIRPYDGSYEWFWIGFAIHFLGFVIFWGISSAMGWWGEPLSWEAERGHGVFTQEVSPAYLWDVLAIMAAVRCIILQPIYLIIYRIRRR